MSDDPAPWSSKAAADAAWIELDQACELRLRFMSQHVVTAMRETLARHLAAAFAAGSGELTEFKLRDRGNKW